MSGLGEILGDKFDHESGIETREDTDPNSPTFGEVVITAWPDSLGPEPTDTQITAWTTAHDAARPDREKQQAVDSLSADQGILAFLTTYAADRGETLETLLNRIKDNA